MATFDFSSGTSALTNALKQVFYIHKDVVTEFKGKIDALTKENEALRQRQISSDNVISEPCQSCNRLEELNLSLQETFNRQLKDKDAVINHLEERLEKLLGSISCDALLGPGKVLTPKKSSPRSKIFDTHSATSPANSPRSADSKLASKLKLPKDGQKRRRYVEQENTPDSKRQKVSPSSTDTDDAQVDSRQENAGLVSSQKQNQRLTRNRSRDFQRPAKCQGKNILVPETVNFTCSEEHIDNRIKDITNEKSPNFLTIPETLVMDDYNEEYDDKDEDDEDTECEDTLKEIENVRSKRFACPDSSSQQKSCPASKGHKLKNDSRNYSKSKENYGLGQECELNEACKIVEKDMKLATLVSTRMKMDPGNNVSITSPLSPGIFDDVARPSSNSDTPRSSKNPDCDSGKKFISCSAKPSREIEKFLRSKPAVDRMDKSGLLRQTTLSQSFNSHNTKQGVRKSKSVRSKSEFDREEEAILQEAIEQSLMEADKSVLGKMPGGNTSLPNNLTSDKKSPFKIPLSPCKEIRKSPRSKIKKNYTNLNNDRNAESLDEISRKTGKNFVAEENDSEPVRNDVFTTSISSPSRNVKVSGQGLRRSPRLLSTSPKHENSPGDLAKRALFLDNSKKLVGSNASSVMIHKWRDEDTDEDDFMDRNTNGSLGMNASMDPIMRLSMYLDSEVPATTTSTTTTSAINNKPLSVQPEIREDMDETVAPNAMSFSVSAAMGDRHIENTCHQDSIVIDDGGEGDGNQDDISETIAPSPQQQSARPFYSQSQSGLVSTCQSFKFINTVKHNGASSKTGKKIDHGSQKIVEVEKDGTCLESKIENIDRNVSQNNYDDIHFGDAEADVDDVTVGKTGSEFKPSPRQPVQSLATLYDSFDVVPNKSPEFPHVQIVRKKADRDKLQGFSCRQCAEYYKDMNLSENELQQRMRACSRHKQKYKAPDTPEHFWSLSIRDTAEDQAEVEEKLPKIARIRRRRRLEKKFKSKTEEEEGAE